MENKKNRFHDGDTQGAAKTMRFRGALRISVLIIAVSILAAWRLIASTSAAASGGPPAVGDGPPAPWILSCADCPRDFYQVSERGFALDSAGRPHIVYAGDLLHYAWFDGSAWTIETIDLAPGQEDVYELGSSSLALDAAGAPHVAYLSPDLSALRYATRVEGTWQIETISTVPTGKFNYDVAIALDSGGNPRIAYSRNGVLELASLSESGWTFEVADDPSLVEFHIALALDADDRPHISYYHHNGPNGGELRYAYGGKGGWEVDIVDNSAWLGEHNSIAVDSAGGPHISFVNFTNKTVHYASLVGDKWVIETIDQMKWVGGFTSLVIDEADHPHISYTSLDYDLKYARWDGAAWQLETVTTADSRGTSLVLDAAGHPRIAHFTWEGRQLALATFNGADSFGGGAGESGGGWQIETVDRLPEVGRHASLALDAEDRPHIAYTDHNRGELRYAFSDGSAWEVAVLDAIGTEGGYASLALDGAGGVYISYYDAIDGDLKLARNTAGSWEIETVDAAGDVGQYTSLALGSGGEVWIAYYAAGAASGAGDAAGSGAPNVTGGGALKLAREDGDDWLIETVDAAGGPGLYASLELDDQDHPHIAYYAAAAGDLRYAVHDGAGWDIAVVDTAGVTGLFASLALNAAGQPRISYFDDTTRDLRYAHLESAAWQADTTRDLRYARLDGATWQTETVDSTGFVGQYTSLALDGQGFPRISYHAVGVGLKFAFWDGTGWGIAVVDTGASTGRHTSLALDSRGLPHIASEKEGFRDLHYAVGLFLQIFLPLVLR